MSAPPPPCGPARGARAGRVAVALAAASAALAGCGDPGPAAPPNVLLVVVDTLRADHTSLHGYPRDTTPNLAAFAEGGLVFERARSSSSWTKPSTASLMTGLSAAQHGVEQEDGRLPDAAATLAEVLWASGYRTGLFSDNPFVSRGFGFAQGFEHVYDYASREIARPSGETYDLSDAGAVRKDELADWKHRAGAPAIDRELLAWLASIPESEPWFAHVQYMEPHWPYAPPPPFDAKFTDAPIRRSELPNLWGVATGFAGAERGTEVGEAERQRLVDAYDAMVAYWDDCFGRLVAQLESWGRLRNTIVVVTSDHGEGFFEHGVWAHQNSLYEELVRVPLVIRGPGIASGRIARDVASMRVVGTLLALTGHDARDLGAGGTLLDEDAPAWQARLERDGRTLVATLDRGRKWIFHRWEDGARVEAFDLARDPDERLDRAPALSDHGERLRARVERELALERESGLARAAARIGDDTREALRALGYAE